MFNISHISKSNCLSNYYYSPYPLHTRFPKNREIAAKWNSFLGIDPNKILNGTICAEHFEETCFKRKDHSELKPNSVPSKLNSDISVPSLPSYDEPVGHIFDENHENSENTTNNSAHLHSSLSPVATTAEAMQAENQECMECKMKDELIEKKDVQIKNLQNRLKKAQKRIWYLENVKKKT